MCAGETSRDSQALRFLLVLRRWFLARIFKQSALGRRCEGLVMAIVLGEFLCDVLHL
jgi:hypothetical protein